MDVIGQANALINKHYVDRIWPLNDSFFALKLAADVVNEINGTRLGVAFHVFSQLQKRGFASSDIVNVARGVVDAFDQGRINAIAMTSNEGLLLIKIIAVILKTNAAANATSARAVKLNTAILAATPKPKPPNVVAVQITQTELTWYESYAKTKKLSFNKDISWDLPTSGTGFTTYNTDDLKGKNGDLYGYDQIGTKATIDAMINIGVEWNKLHSDRMLQYGDVSRPGGMDTPDHATHMDGKAFDMRPIRNDALTGNAARVPSPSDPAYHRDHTKEFILLVRRLYPGTTVYYNDSQIYNDKAYSSFVSRKAKHDDHLHIMLKI